MNPVEATEQYRNQRSKYERLTAKIDTLIKILLDHNGLTATVEARTKSVESFNEKITRPGKNYSDPINDVTDLCAIRIITYSLQDVEKVAQLIRGEFFVDDKRSVNKADLLDPDRFGYLSQQYIVQVRRERGVLAEWKEHANIWFEIQVRTLLQHAWAVVDHALLYKGQPDAPPEIRRRLARVMALFEMADEELDRLISDRKSRIEKYKVEIATSKPQIEINVDSLRVYLQTEESQYWLGYLRDKIGLGIYDTKGARLSHVVEECEQFGVRYIEDLDALLEAAHGWGELLFDRIYDLPEESYLDDQGVRHPGKEDIMVSDDGHISMLLQASKAEEILLKGIENFQAVPRLIKLAIEIKAAAKK